MGVKSEPVPAEGQPKKIELLAPAGTLASGIAAINCGADAVYIGADRFGARDKAGNRVGDIAVLCDYAHKYWARVYVAVNTILTDAELPAAVSLIHELHAAGIDALIIQDVGLLETDLPDIPLIASTQMHNHTTGRVAFLEKVGFKRVILARELSLDQIADIRRHTSVELECFVHGALCVGYSGQCYLSHAIGGRSGNRGACAQPCRKRYTLTDGAGQVIRSDACLLSLKDFNLSKYLDDLIRAGITSFKIEGRLKDPSYITNIVSYYRRKLDVVLADRGLEKISSGKSEIAFVPDPAKSFNRRFTDYFIQGRHRDMASLKTPKSLGVKMGTVVTVGKNYFTIKPAADFCAGDGICFFDKTDRLCGTYVHKAEKDKIFPDKMANIDKGTIIFRNHDHRFVKQLEKTRVSRKIGLQMTLSETDTGFMLKAVDEDGNKVRHIFDIQKVPAQKKEAATATIEKQLTKLGETPFNCDRLRINTSTPYFIKVRELNDMRRQVVEQLIAERETNRPRSAGKILKNSVPFPEKKLSYRGNVLNQKAEQFYRRHGVDEIEPAPEAGLDMKGKPVMISKYCILFQLGLCRKNPNSPDIKEPLVLVDDAGRRFTVRPRCRKCEMEILMES